MFIYCAIRLNWWWIIFTFINIQFQTEGNLFLIQLECNVFTRERPSGQSWVGVEEKRLQRRFGDCFSAEAKKYFYSADRSNINVSLNRPKEGIKELILNYLIAIVVSIIGGFWPLGHCVPKIFQRLAHWGDEVRLGTWRAQCWLDFLKNALKSNHILQN